MALKIALNMGRTPAQASLKALAEADFPLSAELYCLCADKAEADQAQNFWTSLKKSVSAPSHKAFFAGEFSSLENAANALFLNSQREDDFLLFLSSNIALEKDALKRMIASLKADPGVAGANPLLLAGWLKGAERRAAFAGLAFDCQKQLHYLYEGALAENPLLKKERFFQLAHPGALLLRAEDFAAVGGFQDSLGFLAFPSLCLSLLKLRPKGFACLPQALGALWDKFDSWDVCGLWNSVLQRGRLDTGVARTDYPEICLGDGMGYGLDPWLNEGPVHIPDLSDSPAVRRWQEWRYNPRPASLLAFLSSLQEEERAVGVELARNRPSSLPRTLQYYRAQADKLSELAGSSYPALTGMVEAWRKKTRQFHYRELKPGIELLKKAGIYNCSLDTSPAVFDAWVETAEKFERLEVSGSWPGIAVIMPVWNPRPEFLKTAIESALGQTYSDFTLCIADDASAKREIRPLLESFAREDKRVRIKFRDSNGHISRATNTALEMASEPYAAFMDHDDLLAPQALGEVARLLFNRPDLGFIYSDEDVIDESNVRRNPVFKPDFDRDLFFAGHLSVYDTDLVRRIGGLRPGVEGSQDQDLARRAAELLDESRIAHIPKILYHWRVHEESTAGSVQAKPYIVEATRKVLLEAAARDGRLASWPGEKRSKHFKLLYQPRRDLSCSVVLLTGKTSPGRALLETVKDLERYVRTEIFVQPLSRSAPKVKGLPSLPYAGEEIPAACNSAAFKAGGDIILFLAADLEPAEECRLEQLAEMASLPRIAMAGGAIWSGGSLLNGGWQPNADGLPFPLLQGFNQINAENSAWGQILLPRRVLGVPWQCMAVKGELARGGAFLNEKYGSLATVEFAIRAMRTNRFAAMNPWVNLRTNSSPRPPDGAEINFLRENYGEEIAVCGLRNPNLRAAWDKDWTLAL